MLLNLGLAITVWYTDASELMPSLRSVWLAIHVTVATLSVAVFTIGFSLGVMYLIQDRLETAAERPAQLHGAGCPTPARWSGSRTPCTSSRSRCGPSRSSPARSGPGRPGASYWNWDPKEVWSFVIWVVYAAYLHARATTGWKRQNAVWIALVGYGCIILNFAVVNVFFVGQHSYSGL